ncbi:MAG TPA: YdeI/OmpD-associated family protein [Microlunatus sp.]|nr:YdeI/OmpD-associated family protein [Microlunatus sp.]
MAAAECEFPTGIGKVAARELAINGITRYDQLTRRTRKDLLAVHGVGPKAVRLLGEELSARGLAFLDESDDQVSAAGAAGTGHRFRATIELHGKTATGFEVPAEVVSALASGKKPKVSVTIGPHTYRSTVAVYGDLYMLPLSAENRTAAGVAAGQRVDVELVLDSAPRTVAVPDDLAAALRERPEAKAAFDALSYSHRRAHVLAVEAAKRPETRARRVAKAVEQLTT